jgi:hypothetical protein
MLNVRTAALAVATAVVTLLVLQPHLWVGAAGPVVASSGAGLVSSSPVGPG